MINEIQIPLRNHYHHPKLSAEEEQKVEYHRTIQTLSLFERIHRLIGVIDFHNEVKKHLIDYYVEGCPNTDLDSRQSNLLSLMDEYIELYLYDQKEEFFDLIIGELTYNSLYNGLKNE